MPSFDITEKTIDFVYENIKNMAGNAGQETLIQMLVEQMSNGSCTLNAEVTPLGLDASGRMDLDFSSPHEEAIFEIIEHASQQAELFAKQAEEPGPWEFSKALETGNWKIVGWDQ